MPQGQKYQGSFGACKMQGSPVEDKITGTVNVDIGGWK